MEEVDGLGSGREVGRLEFPKTNLGSRIVGRKKKTKMKPGKKTARGKKIKIMRKKSSKIKKTTDQVN